MYEHQQRNQTEGNVEDEAEDDTGSEYGSFWPLVVREYHILSEGGNISPNDYTLMTARLAGREEEIDPRLLARTLHLLLGATPDASARLLKLQNTPVALLVERSRPDNRKRQVTGACDSGIVILELRLI